MSEPQTIPGGTFLSVVAENPQSVCCEEALLATALLTVGVDEHERIKFTATQDGDTHRWLWLFAAKSRCGTYETAQLFKWWHDAEWRTANPTHEWTLIHRILHNHAEEARRIRGTVPRILVRRGSASAHIPADASDEYTAHIIAQLEGRIPMSEPYTGPLTRTITIQ